MAVTDRVALFMDDVAERAVAALAEAARPVGRVVAIAPGTAPAWDGDCQGYLYGRIVSIAPGPQGGTVPVNVRCGVHYWVATLAIAVVRCLKGVVDDRGKPPLPAAVDADGHGFSMDAAVLEQVLLCSQWTRSIIQGVPLEEQGGYSGFEWTYTVRYDVCDCGA